MEVYEKISHYIKDRKLSKKEFAKLLIASSVKLRNTGDVPSENTIYAYLNGRIGIKIELIPYIAEILGIPEQILFDDSPRARKNFLKYILDSATSEEVELIKSKICDDKMAKINIAQDRFHKIQDLLIYAPEIFLDEVEKTLKNYKDLTIKFQK